MSEALSVVLFIGISFSMKWKHGQRLYKSFHCILVKIMSFVSLTVALKVTPVSLTKHEKLVRYIINSTLVIYLILRLCQRPLFSFNFPSFNLLMLFLVFKIFLLEAELKTIGP